LQEILAQTRAVAGFPVTRRSTNQRVPTRKVWSLLTYGIFNWRDVFMRDLHEPTQRPHRHGGNASRGLRPSGLGSTEMQEALLKESRVKQQIGGVTHGIKQIIEYAAIEAIQSGEERITKSLLTAWRAVHGGR
jgi:hypothetical protein